MDEIEQLLTRGVSNIISSKNVLAGKLHSNKKLNVYLGIDPTATKIHLGHAMPLRKLQQFAALGHNVTFLIGDFTALIGDTSDKDSERPALTSEEVIENFKTYKKQAEKILDFSKIKVEYNSKWLSKLDFKEIIKLTQLFSVGDFVGRELIKKRLTENKRVGLHELLYPVMQGYDSYFMDTDIQIGGADQVFNMQAGRTLQEKLRHKESFVLCTDYLLGTDGRKMSKSWGNAIWLDDSPTEMYTKTMAIGDDLIIQYFVLATDLPLDEIKKHENKLKKENPINIKKALAFEIVKELHGEKQAKDAQSEFESRVQKKEIPTEQELLELSGEKHSTILDALVFGELTESKSTGKRLIEQGGVSLNDKKITNANSEIEEGILKVGKRKFVKVVLK